MKIKHLITTGIIGVFSIISNQSNAQIKVGLDILPIGYSSSTTEKSHKLNYGFNLYGKYEFKNNFRTGLNFGFMTKPNNYLGFEGKNFVMPISGLLEYKFNTGKLSPYIGFETGFSTLFSENGGIKISKPFYTFTPVLGLEYKINERFFINANTKYEIVHGNSGKKEKGLNIGIGIGIKF